MVCEGWVEFECCSCDNLQLTCLCRRCLGACGPVFDAGAWRLCAAVQSVLCSRSVDCCQLDFKGVCHCRLLQGINTAGGPAPHADRRKQTTSRRLNQTTRTCNYARGCFANPLTYRQENQGSHAAASPTVAAQATNCLAQHCLNAASPLQLHSSQGSRPGRCAHSPATPAL